MANLGSDVSQLFLHREKGERKYAALAQERARKIIAELLRHAEVAGGTGEIKIMKDIIEDTTPNTSIPRSQLEEYFMPFALRVLNP